MVEIYREKGAGQAGSAWKAHSGDSFFSYLAIVAAATILWRRGSGIGVNLHFLRAFFEARNSASVQGWINVILNVAMFVPIGLLLPAVNGVFRKWYVTLAAGAGMSLVVETAQVVLRRGTGDIDDLVTNTLGCALGYCLVHDGVVAQTAVI